LLGPPAEKEGDEEGADGEASFERNTAAGSGGSLAEAHRWFMLATAWE
jgi:predicted outer membrane repeat protein